MKTNLIINIQKVLRRVSGKESRSLWHELVQTQNELASKNDRHSRVHPYIAEALNVIAPPIEVLRRESRELEALNSVFSKFGSDKDSRHSYGNVYQQIIKKFTTPRIL